MRALSLLAMLCLVACGSRTDLATGRAIAGTAGAAGTAGSGGGGACGPEGAMCVADQDCCDLPCTGGVCAVPPPPCLGDGAPVLVLGGLQDPFALAGDATSLFVGQLEKGQTLFRVPKAGGMATPLVDPVDFADVMAVRDGTLFYSDDDALRAIPTGGGTVQTIKSAFGPTGFAVAKDRIYLAEYLGKKLVQIDRATGESKVLVTGKDGIYRVAATDDAVYFTTFFDGLFRYRLSTGAVDNIAPELGEPRAVLAYAGDVYYTVPKTQRVYRLPPMTDTPEMIADLSSLGMYPEALQTDGSHLYLTLATGQNPGFIVRVPMAGGAPEVVTPSAGAQPSALVVDEGCVYWTERDGGQVFRARKAPP